MTHAVCDPLYFFDWKDTEPPIIQPLVFVPESSSNDSPPTETGLVTVSGRVDILAAIADRPIRVTSATGAFQS